MKKYLLFSLIIFLSIPIGFANNSNQRRDTKDTNEAFGFYLKNNFLVEFSLDSRSIQSVFSPEEIAAMPAKELEAEKEFQTVFDGKDLVVGETEINKLKVYADLKTGCFYRDGNGRDSLYHLEFMPGSYPYPSMDSYNIFKPSIIWKDKTVNNASYNYLKDTTLKMRRCADLVEKKRAKSLKLTGRIKDLRLKVYEPKNPSASKELKMLYKNAVFPSEKLTFARYIGKHPLIYIEDGLGFLHRMANTDFVKADYAQ